MQCKTIRVRDFRNIEYAEVELSPSVNLLVGENAQGKTNLLEAIFYTALGKSFRTQHDEDMIRFGCDMAEISMDFCDSIREQTLTVRMMRGKRRMIEQNHLRVGRVSDIVGQFRTVLFCPEHLSLIKEGPSERRNFLDVALSQLYPLYLKSLQRYHQILKQRNQLIRRAEEDRRIFLDTVEFWSLQLAHEAAIIAKYRYRYVKEIEREMAACFADMMGGRETPRAIYLGSSGQDEEEYESIETTEQRYRTLLTTRYEREIGAGSTLWGIHKDDVQILLNGKEARSFASQGQQRSLALSMKLAEGEVCREICSELPVFLLDDVFSELDASRRAYLSGRIEGRQVIITTCEPSLLGGERRIVVENGHYRQQ